MAGELVGEKIEEFCEGNHMAATGRQAAGGSR